MMHLFVTDFANYFQITNRMFATLTFYYAMMHIKRQPEKVAQQVWPSPAQPPEVTVTLEVTVTFREGSQPVII